MDVYGTYEEDKIKIMQKYLNIWYISMDEKLVR